MEETMTTLGKSALALLCLFALAPAYGADKPLTAQQQKMKDCNATASENGLSDGPRKDFMSKCLSSDGELTAQQLKMKSCNKKAGDQHLKGDARKGFMKDCLKS
jgi:hypothetical protein